MAKLCVFPIKHNSFLVTLWFSVSIFCVYVSNCKFQVALEDSNTEDVKASEVFIGILGIPQRKETTDSLF